jgi:hypothetical protein
MNGSPAGVSVAGSTITADYAAVNGPLAPGEVVVLRFRAVLDPGSRSARWSRTPASSPGTPHADGERQRLDRRRRHPRRSPAERLGWHDADFDDVRIRRAALAGWSVDLYRDNARGTPS